jgi:hypothetical protein
MYALIRESTIRPGAEEQFLAARSEFNTLHSEYAGYCGSVTFDAGDGKRLSVVLWADENAYQTALPNMLVQAAELMGPHLTAPSRVVFQGEVVSDDLTTR